MAPKVVTATDEADLAKQMEKAELENAEVLVPFLILTDSLPPHKITSRCPVMTTTTTKNKLEWAERSRKEKTIRRTRKAKAVIEEHDPATIFLLFVLLNLRKFHDYDDRRRSKHYSSSKNVGHRFFFIYQVFLNGTENFKNLVIVPPASLTRLDPLATLGGGSGAWQIDLGAGAPYEFDVPHHPLETVTSVESLTFPGCSKT
jgi:hypothetical protein